LDKRTIKVTYTENLVRSAVRTYVWRQVVAGQKKLWAIEAVMIALVVWMLWQGERGWSVGAIGVFIFLPPVLVITIWASHYRSAVGRFRSMSRHDADVTFFDDGLQVESELGSSKIPWAMFTEIWERPNYWMLIISPNQYLTFPIEMVSSTDRYLVKSKVSSANSR
jgi:YcxB-like protein